MFYYILSKDKDGVFSYVGGGLTFSSWKLKVITNCYEIPGSVTTAIMKLLSRGCIVELQEPCR